MNLKELRKMNIYEIARKIENGKNTTWIENAIYAGFSPEEIVKMVETNDNKKK